jgi:hypothetical protein
MKRLTEILGTILSTLIGMVGTILRILWRTVAWGGRTIAGALQGIQMKNLTLVAYLDIRESLRSRWFYVYAFVFGGLMGLFFISGITDSVVMGFTGLSRLLLVFMQVTIIILPIFILITTVKSISGDRESNILEYMLSFPISLNEYYW